MINKADAVDAFKTIINYCNNIECSECMFCPNPEADYGERHCFFHEGESPDAWYSYSDVYRGLKDDD